MYNVVNYNIGNGSRTIIASQVNSSIDQGAFASQHLSTAECQNPLKAILNFFELSYSLPVARLCLEELSLNAGYDMPVEFWERKEEVISFILDFSRLIEASYLIRNEARAEWKVKKVSKGNLIPIEILQKGRTLDTILAHLPMSRNPKDSLDPILNLRIVFFDAPLHELLESFKAWGRCAMEDQKSSKEIKWSSHINKMVLDVILDACHLIYVRSQSLPETA
ncbi:hypothetical protein [Algoriphagus sp.]|uniref:hypothetical protein n=1 Tax=Algoriphagus sp. TaxID=1872435 RepID=UPI003F725C84